MDEILETVKEHHSETEEMFAFSDNGLTALEEMQYETRNYKVKDTSLPKEVLFLTNRSVKKQTIPKEYTVVDYLIFYLILFIFIGINTLIFTLTF